MKRLLLSIIAAAAGAWLCSAQPAATEEVSVEDQFKAAFDTMVKADEARDKGNSGEAMRLYRQALDAYMKVHAKYPDLQPGVTKYRVAYCNSQFEALMKKANGHATPADEGGGDTKPPGGTPGPKKQISIDEIRSTVKLLLRTGETAKARSLLLEAMKIDPDNATIRLLMGIAQCQAGQYEDAALVLKQLTDDTPTNANAHAALGAAYFGMGKLAEAREETGKAIKIQPNLQEAHYNMAQILLSLRPPEPSGAAYHYRKHIDLGGPHDKELEKKLE